jgi:hypothetical protein
MDASKYADLVKELCLSTTDINAVLAIILVEAGGAGIHPATGRPIIRFEPHKFYELYGHLNHVVFDSHFKFNKIKPWTDHFFSTEAEPNVWRKLHVAGDTNQSLEWSALETAMNMDPSSAPFAIQAASWGAGQIMGFHYSRLGYTSPFDMMRDAYSERSQIAMLIHFIDSDSRLSSALDNKEWTTFARYYNGTGQVPVYAELLRKAYAKLTTS